MSPGRMDAAGGIDKVRNQCRPRLRSELRSLHGVGLSAGLTIDVPLFNPRTVKSSAGPSRLEGSLRVPSVPSACPSAAELVEIAI
jgi:hypothetical protein